MNWKTPVTIVVLILLLVGATTVGWQYATDDVPSLRDATSTDDPETRCRTFNSGQALETRSVTVNVFNTSGEPNLAGRTMSQFTSRGFSGGVAENSEQRVPGGRVLLTAADRNSAQLRLVRTQLKGPVRARAVNDPDTGSAVNVYLGKRFEGLRRNAPGEVKVQGRTRVCFEVDD